MASEGCDSRYSLPPGGGEAQRSEQHRGPSARNGILYHLEQCTSAMLDKLLVALLSIILLAGWGSAVVSVHPGESIQAAVDAAQPGDTIEVYGGVYSHSIEVNKPLHLRGIDSGDGLPRVETDDGPAITLKANGITLEGFRVRSTSSWEGDAGLLVSSSHNIIKNNFFDGNGGSGILLEETINNTLIGNSAQDNRDAGMALLKSNNTILEKNTIIRNECGISLQDSGSNLIEGNTVQSNDEDGIYLLRSGKNSLLGNLVAQNSAGIAFENCEENLVAKNDVIGNQKGISLTSWNATADLTSQGKGVYIKHNRLPEEKRQHNNTIYSNNLSNAENAYDDGSNHWDNGKLGNNYSDFNDIDEGCLGKSICSSAYAIQGGQSIDRFPIAAPPKPTGIGAEGPDGLRLALNRSSYHPGGMMGISYVIPASIEAWIGLEAVQGSDQYLGKNLSGQLVWAAPDNEGSYHLRMHDKDGNVLLTLAFSVSLPRLLAWPSTVGTCENIQVSFSGSSGQREDWIGMFHSGSADVLSKEFLKGMQSGNVTFYAPETGAYEFRMFEAGSADPACSSQTVTVEPKAGLKVIAEPSRVSPGGTVTVTYWGAPASGSGVIGMYPITTPDKFWITMQSVRGGCGRITFRAPGQPGNYDFRLFEDNVYRKILGQSNGVTVG
jgi:nitrous oxidase accessory protein